MFRRSSDVRTGLACSKFKIDRFKHYLLKESVLATCRLEQVRTRSSVAELFLQEGQGDELPKGRVVRLILPYRAELRDLPGKVAELLGDKNRLLRDVLGITLRVQICWGKAGTALAQICGRRTW